MSAPIKRGTSAHPQQTTQVEKAPDHATTESSSVPSEPDSIQEAEVVDTSTPTKFGIFAHQAYEAAVYDAFDEVFIEEQIRIRKADGTMADGEIDTRIGKTLIDYKTDNMRGWSAADARRYAHDHGRQLKEYIDSPDAPSNAKGWIVATVPPESESIRKIFSETLDQYGIGVKFTKSEDPTAVVEAVKSAMRDS